MSLADKINAKFEVWRKDLTTGLAGFLVQVWTKGLEVLLDVIGKALKPVMMPTIDKLLAEPDIPADVKNILTQLKTTDGQFGAQLLGGLATSMLGGTASASLMPGLELMKQTISKKTRFQVFDYPIVLAAWLRDKVRWESLFEDLRRRGYYDYQIDILKELVYMIPSAPDLIRMAVKEVFTPEIVQKYGQMQDFPADFAKWGAQIGLSEVWCKNYWAAHWDLPSPTQGYEMLHRGVITYDDLKVLLRALDVMPYWRDKLIQIAYSPYTRVDIRRMYKLGILDRDGVKRAYKDIGYDDEHAEALTKFTEEYYAKPSLEEEDQEDEELQKVRDLTRADICDGYKRAMLTRTEATEDLSTLGYDPDEIDFYLDREDLKSTQELKDAYASNYRQLYVTGILNDEDVKSALTTLGLPSAEVDNLLKLWYIERVRRAERPTRTDLARFLRKEIITAEEWKTEMAKLGYSDDYIEWYLQDIIS